MGVDKKNGGEINEPQREEGKSDLSHSCVDLCVLHVI